VIVNDLNLIRIARTPAEANAPLIVDANTMLAGAITLEFLKPVAGRDAEIIKGLRGVNGDELSEHGPLQFRRKAADRASLEQRFGVPVGEALDHSGS
jgi:hypothetical protein